MKLSANFTLAEMTVTSTGAFNTPNETQTSKLLYVCSYILQPVRTRFGKIKVTSGFRTEFVNEKIGGAKTSQHVAGEAVDFIPLEANFTPVFDWCRRNLVYGQCILETNAAGAMWIHCSLPRIGGVNQQALKCKNGVYSTVKEEVAQ